MIQRLGTNQVTLHFGTEANRKYELQYLVKGTTPTNAVNTNSMSGQTNRSPIGVWSNHFVAPSIPFSNHYVILDTITNQSRLYRLRATP